MVVVGNSKALEALVKLGFKEYQAKVYCTLVALGQGSATDVHKASGVPRPRVYDTLEELVKLGVLNYNRGRPVVYQPVEPAAVVEWSRKGFLTAGDEAIRQLDKLSAKGEESSFELIWVLRKDDNIDNKMKKMISEAKEEILIRFFDLERYLELEKQLRDAKRRKVRVRSIVLTDERALLERISDLAGTVDFRVTDLAKMAVTRSDETGILRSILEIVPGDSWSNLSDLGFVVIDSRESIFVLGDRRSGYRYAVWFGLPLITRIQRAVFTYVWTMSDETKNRKLRGTD
jgi:sugar-specific transcriptional regulator TrmB